MSTTINDRRPALFGQQPRFGTLDEVQAALNLLSWLASKKALIEAEHKRSIDRMNTAAAQQMRLEVEDVTVSYDEYIVGIESGIREFVQANPEPWATKRTVEFPAGTVALRQMPQRIELIDETPTQFVKRVGEKFGIVEKLIAWLKRQKLWPFVRLKPELNLSEIKAAFARGEIDKAALKRFGLQVVPARDEVVITPRVN